MVRSLSAFFRTHFRDVPSVRVVAGRFALLTVRKIADMMHNQFRNLGVQRLKQYPKRDFGTEATETYGEVDMLL